MRAVYVNSRVDRGWTDSGSSSFGQLRTSHAEHAEPRLGQAIETVHQLGFAAASLVEILMPMG